jgi:hypothetical protein
MSEADTLRTCYEEFEDALRRGQMLVTASGPNSVKLLEGMLNAQRANAHFTRAQAHAAAFASLPEESQRGVILEAKQNLTDRLAAERAAEEARIARSFAIVGKGSEIDILKSARDLLEIGRTTLTRQDYEEELLKRASAFRQPTESPEAACTRYITHRPEGALLLKASLQAPVRQPAAPKPDAINKNALAVEIGRRLTADANLSRAEIAKEQSRWPAQSIA